MELGSDTLAVARPGSIVISKRTGWFLSLLGALLLLLIAHAVNWPPPILAVDQEQGRINQALPLLRNGVRVQYTFYPKHDGLAEVEVQLARYQDGTAEGELTLQLWNETREQLVASQTFDTAALSHNQTVRLRLPPQRDSAGQPYTIHISGAGNNPFSVWGYTLSGSSTNKLQPAGADTTARDLRFVSRYQWTPGLALRSLGRVIMTDGPLLGLSLLFILLPGCLTLSLWGPSRRWDPAAWWGVAVALGVTLWSLLWFWLTMAGGSWSNTSLWTVFVTGWVAVLFSWWRQRSVPRAPMARWRREHAALLLLLLLGLAVRLLAIRDLSFPPWVDAVRHGLITEIMVRQRQVPFSYGSLLPIDRFPYHFGFHTLPASILLMTDWSLPRTLLMLGQLLNALTPLILYATAWLLTRQRRAALASAFLVALPFLFPAYYATWGRYTQLTGMLVLPPLVAFTWLLLRASPPWRRSWWIVGLLASGLFLIHVRVWLYFLPFATLVWVMGYGRQWREIGGAAALTVLLVGARALQLLPRNTTPATFANNIPDYNVFPIGYITSGWERYFILLALASVPFVLVAALRNRHGAAPALALVGWVALLFFLLAGRVVGLPESWLVNLNSMYIILFFPLALLLGITFDWLWRWLGGMPVPVRVSRDILLGVVVSALLLFGIRQQVTVLNPETLLAHEADLAGLEWISENLPVDARVAVSSWRWLGSAWSATDGGAWILPLTGRMTTTPPADYTYNPALAGWVAAFNQTASTIEEWSDPTVVTWLQEQGVSHLYVGARGGFLDPSALVRNPRLSLVYNRDGVFIFEVDGSTGTSPLPGEAVLPGNHPVAPSSIARISHLW